MRGLLMSMLLVAGCDLATDAGEGAVGGSADAGPSDFTPPDEECPAYDGSGMVCLGSFEVRNFADLDVIASCARITGDLDLGANGLIEIVLPLLERVDGNVTLWPSTSLERISLPELKEIGGHLAHVLAQISVLTELELPRLRTVAGEFLLRDSGGYGATSLTGLSLDCLDSAGSLRVPGAVVNAPRLTSMPGSVAAGLQAPLLDIIGGELEYQQGTFLPALRRVDGGLTIGVTDAVNLPALQNVVRAAVIGCSAAQPTATALDLPVLWRAGAMRICPWPSLATVSLPALRRIAGPAALGGLHIGAGGSLSAVDLPLLDTLAGSASFAVATSIPILTAISGSLVLDAPVAAPALATVAGGVTANHSIDLPALASVSGHLQLFVQSGNLVFPALTSIGGVLKASGTTAVELRAPALLTIGGNVTIADNLALADIDFASLTSIGLQLTIVRNPELPTCQAEALRDQLWAAGWVGTVKIAGNGTGTCP